MHGDRLDREEDPPTPSPSQGRGERARHRWVHGLGGPPPPSGGVPRGAHMRHGRLSEAHARSGRSVRKVRTGDPFEQDLALGAPHRPGLQRRLHLLHHQVGPGGPEELSIGHVGPKGGQGARARGPGGPRHLPGHRSLRHGRGRATARPPQGPMRPSRGLPGPGRDDEPGQPQGDTGRNGRGVSPPQGLPLPAPASAERVRSDHREDGQGIFGGCLPINGAQDALRRSRAHALHGRHHRVPGRDR